MYFVQRLKTFVQVLDIYDTLSFHILHSSFVKIDRVIDEETESIMGCNLLGVRDSNPVFDVLFTNRN